MHRAPPAVLVAAFLLAGCGEVRERAQTIAVPKRVTARPAPPTAPACTAPTTTTARSSTVLHVVRAFAARRRPAGRTLARIAPINRFGLRTTLLALAVRVDRRCAPTWYRAKLPLQPNGVTGWVPARAVSVARVRSRLVADISARRLDLFEANRRVLRLRAGFGADLTPTPVGRFYIDAHWRVDDPSGPYGPAVLAIAAYSQAPEGRWEHGLPSAVHGTNAPWTIGQRASHGCIHVENDELARLLRLVPDGTPIEIRA